MTSARETPRELDAFRENRTYLGDDHRRNERRTWIVAGICLITLVALLAGGALFRSMAEFGASFDPAQVMQLQVEAARECLQVHEVESTKRARFQAYEATEVARIKAAEAFLKNYFDQAFAERRGLYQELFARLDRALDDGNGEILQDVVRGIVDIAQHSPLRDIGDLGQVRAALDDPDQVWEL